MLFLEGNDLPSGLLSQHVLFGQFTTTSAHLNLQLHRNQGGPPRWWKALTIDIFTATHANHAHRNTPPFPYWTTLRKATSRSRASDACLQTGATEADRPKSAITRENSPPGISALVLNYDSLWFTTTTHCIAFTYIGLPSIRNLFNSYCACFWFLVKHNAGNKK